MTNILTTQHTLTGLTLLGVLLAPGLAAGDLDDPRRAVEGGLEQVLGLVIVEAAERVRDGGLGHGAVQTLDVWRHALPALLDSSLCLHSERRKQQLVSTRTRTNGELGWGEHCTVYILLSRIMEYYHY